LAYPVLSRRLGEQGTVVVRVLVDEQGWPRQPSVWRSSGFERLDQAALRHISASRFVPGRSGHQPLAMWHDAPVEFRLQ
jgi:protein TonB